MPERAVDVSNQGWRQQEYLHLGIGDLNQALAKIDLKLLAGRRLKAHCRSRLRCQRPPIGRHRPLDRAQANEKALLGDQLLANDIRVATMAIKPLPEPALLPIKNLPARRLLVGPSGAGLDVALDRLRRSQACAQATRTKTQLLQPEQGRYPPALASPPSAVLPTASGDDGEMKRIDPPGDSRN